LAYKDNVGREGGAANGNNSEMEHSLDGGDPEDGNEDEEALQGVYMKAFCSGVSEILQVYKEHLLAIEAEYLKDRSLTIASLQLRLTLYQQMFPALTQLNADIKEHGLRGGELLDTIH